MAFYNELDDILNVVIGDMILKNQDLCKLLYYYPDSKTLRFDPLAQPDIQDTSVLLLDKIFPLPKSPDLETEQTGFMTILLTGGAPTENSGYRKVNLVFDIVCHLNTWIIRDSYRPYRIAEEIDKMFNNQQTKLPIENKPYAIPFRVRDYSNHFYGLQLCYELQLNSNLECNPLPQNLNINKEPEIPIFASHILGHNYNG